MCEQATGARPALPMEAEIEACLNLETEIEACLNLDDEAKMISEIDRLIGINGADAIGGWRDGSKHKHYLIHWLAWKGCCNVLDHVFGFDAPHMFDLDVQRDGDLCTAAHLAIWYKQQPAYEKLVELGASIETKNSYGHTANDMIGFQSHHAEQEQDKSGNLIFIDLEFTSGFYEFRQRAKILEAAIVITDADMNEIANGSWVVGGMTKDECLGLGQFHQTHFRDAADGGKFPPLEGEDRGNGLFSDVLASQTSKKDVEQLMVNLVKQHCARNKCPIVGYSVQCDREVLQREMPNFYRFLSHQIIDISSIFQVAALWAPDKMSQRAGRKSEYNHRAMNDVRDSIESMRWIRDELFGYKPGDVVPNLVALCTATSA